MVESLASCCLSSVNQVRKKAGLRGSTASRSTPTPRLECVSAAAPMPFLCVTEICRKPHLEDKAVQLIDTERPVWG